MSRNFKISFAEGSDNKEIFVVKPALENLQSLVEELYARKPESRHKSLKFYYEGESLVTITILHNNFLKQKR